MLYEFDVYYQSCKARNICFEVFVIFGDHTTFENTEKGLKK